MDSQELERLEKKWLLLDTSVLIRIMRYGDDIQAQLITLTEKYSCTLTVHDLIVQEFLSYTIRQEAYDARLQLIQQYPSLPIGQQEREGAVHMSRIYAINKIKSPSIVDCISAAMMRHYEGRMLLLTNDLKDFPAVLFNPFYVWPFTEAKEIDLYGFFEFKGNKLKQEEAKLAQASQ